MAQIKYGLNFTSSDIANTLEENDRLQNDIRVWRQLFGNASLGYEAQSAAAQTDYASAMAEAYKASLLGRENIYRAGLSAGDTKSALHTYDTNLASAYSTYLQKYRESQASTNEGYATEIGAINTELQDRGQKFADLYSSAFKYWTDILSGSELTSTDAEGKSTTKNLVDEYQLTDLFDDNGKILPWEQAMTRFMDANGALTERGRQFYDQVFNIKPVGYEWTDEKGNTHSAVSFAQWLSDTNPDLYTWVASADPYNYNRAGTNLGTAKVLAGLESTDDEYAPYQYADWSTLKDQKSSGSFDLAADELMKAYRDADHLPNIEPSHGDRGYGDYYQGQRLNAYKNAAPKIKEFAQTAEADKTTLENYAKKQLGAAEYKKFTESKEGQALEKEYRQFYKLAMTEKKQLVGAGKDAEEVDVRTPDDIDNIIVAYNTWYANYIKALEKYASIEKPKASGY